MKLDRCHVNKIISVLQFFMPSDIISLIWYYHVGSCKTNENVITQIYLPIPYHLSIKVLRNPGEFQTCSNVHFHIGRHWRHFIAWFTPSPESLKYLTIFKRWHISLWSDMGFNTPQNGIVYLILINYNLFIRILRLKLLICLIFKNTHPMDLSSLPQFV